MADLVRVYDKDGNEATVSPKWLERWPDDFSTVKPEKKTATAAPKPSGGEKKGNRDVS